MRAPREAHSSPRTRSPGLRRSRPQVPEKTRSVHGELSARGRTPPGQPWAGGAPSVLGSQVGGAEGVQKGRAGPFFLAGRVGGAEVSQRHAGRHGSRGPGPAAPSRSLLAIAAAPWPGLQTRAFLARRGSGAWEPAGPRAGKALATAGGRPGGRAGPGPSPARGAGSAGTAAPSCPAPATPAGAEIL